MIAMRWRWRLAAHLKGKFGWKSVYAWNDETFGPTGTLGRKDTTEAVLIHDLRAALQRLNPELPPSAGDSARYGSITSEWDPIGMAREALVEAERRLAATQRSWGPPPYGRRADCSFLRRETDPHPVFLDKPTRPLDAAAAAWRQTQSGFRQGLLLAPSCRLRMRLSRRESGV